MYLRIIVTAILAAMTLAGCQGDYTRSGDLDCDDIKEMIWVGDSDPHRLDADGDGWGCEEYK